MRQLALQVLTVVALAQPAWAQLTPSVEPCPAYTSPDIKTHIDNAYSLANKEIYPGLIPTMFTLPRAFGLCAPERVGPGFGMDMTPVEPGKMFDQLYYIGTRYLGTFAITTRDGIVLIDTLNSTADVKNIIEPGFKKLGLKMEDIKYVMMTHGLPDHWGGAKYIQDTYHPHIMMTAPDWAIVEAPQPAGSKLPAPPARDMVISEGQKLTLGETTITLYMAPGTTVGAPAMLIPVTDNGKPHLMSLMGGMGVPRGLEQDSNTPPRNAGLLAYIQSAQKIKKMGQAAGADGVVSTHPDFEGTVAKLETMKTRKATDPNPWVLGKDGFARYMDVVYEVAKTVEAEAKDAARLKAAK
jgi:metallo-beta-lactamase class B